MKQQFGDAGICKAVYWFGWRRFSGLSKPLHGGQCNNKCRKTERQSVYLSLYECKPVIS